MHRLSADERLTLILRLFLFLVSATFFTLSLTSPRIAEATHAAWYVRPGIDLSSVDEYGMHFDEGDNWFGARDYNHSSDGSGLIVWLRFEAMQDMPFPIRYNRASFAGGCAMEAEVQLYSNGWTTIGNSQLRYLHIAYPATGVTSSIQLDDDEVEAQAGTIANANLKPECMSGASHLHQSANLESLYQRHEYSDDTCWVDDGDDDGECDADTYGRKHVSCPSGYATTGAPFAKSGEINEPNPDEYICEEWSKESRGGSSYSFYFPRFW